MPPNHRNRCLEMNCNSSFKNIKDLRSHLQDIHDIQFESIKVFLKDMNEFAAWKTKIERASNSSYLLKSRSISAKGEYFYYYCNRSQGGKSRDIRKLYMRRLKSQGLAKMEHTCTSFIKVIKGHSKQEIDVFWYKTHYGHGADLQHLRLSIEDRKLIMESLSKGVTTTEILEQTRSKIGTELKRVDLLTSKDIYNIKKSMNIKAHEDVDLSFDSQVKNCSIESPDNNAILFNKKEGEISNGLDKNDFCLILMNDFQKNLLVKFGKNIVVVDGTHDLASGSSELVYLTVLDDSGVGLPVAFMFTNRTDAITYKIFFRTIKAQIGTLQTRVLLTDIEESAFIAWVNIMRPVTHHLFCPWLVDKAWLKKINETVGRVHRCDLYNTLKQLQQESDSKYFEHKLQSTIKLMLSDENLFAFGNYFKQMFSVNAKKWAAYFQKEIGLDVNTQLESVDKVIKYLYVHRKVVKCVDEGLLLAIKYLRDINIEKRIQLFQGNNYSLAQNIFDNHQAAVCSIYETQSSSEKLWIINNHPGSFFVVQKISDVFCCNIKCPECNICLHMYSCSCSSNLPNASICKHIHYIVLYGSKSLKLPQDEVEFKQHTFVMDSNSGSDNIGAVELNNLVLKTFADLQNSKLQQVDSVSTQIRYHLNIIDTLLSTCTSDLD